MRARTILVIVSLISCDVNAMEKEKLTRSKTNVSNINIEKELSSFCSQKASCLGTKKEQCKTQFRPTINKCFNHSQFALAQKYWTSLRQGKLSQEEYTRKQREFRTKYEMCIVENTKVESAVAKLKQCLGYVIQNNENALPGLGKRYVEPGT